MCSLATKEMVLKILKIKTKKFIYLISQIKLIISYFFMIKSSFQIQKISFSIKTWKNLEKEKFQLQKILKIPKENPKFIVNDDQS